MLSADPMFLGSYSDGTVVLTRATCARGPSDVTLKATAEAAGFARGPRDRQLRLPLSAGYL